MKELCQSVLYRNYSCRMSRCLAKSMAEHNYGIHIPAKLTPAQLTKFEAALVDEFQITAKCQHFRRGIIQASSGKPSQHGEVRFVRK